MYAQIDKPTLKRRWFRFRLRTLLGLVTVLALLMGWITTERRQSRHERQVAEQLRKQGVHLTFGGPYDSFESQKEQGLWREIARNVLGDRILVVFIWESDCRDLVPLAGLRNLRSLTVRSPRISDLTPLAGLKDLQLLTLRSTPVSDLTPLAGLDNLRWLTLRSTQVRDLTPLARLKNLQELHLYSTAVSDEQFESLQRAVPECRILRRD